MEFRQTTADDKAYIEQEIADQYGRRIKPPIDTLRAEIATRKKKHDSKSNKLANPPFAAQVAMEDFKDKVNALARKWEKLGIAIQKEKLQKEVVDKIDWEKYTDPKNFEKIGEGEQYNRDTSKQHPGLRIAEKWVKYQFKGYKYKYTVMEAEEESVARAKKKAQ